MSGDAYDWWTGETASDQFPAALRNMRHFCWFDRYKRVSDVFLVEGGTRAIRNDERVQEISGLRTSILKHLRRATEPDAGGTRDAAPGTRQAVILFGEMTDDLDTRAGVSRDELVATVTGALASEQAGAFVAIPDSWQYNPKTRALLAGTVDSCRHVVVVGGAKFRQKYEKFKDGVSSAVIAEVDGLIGPRQTAAQRLLWLPPAAGTNPAAAAQADVGKGPFTDVVVDTPDAMAARIANLIEPAGDAVFLYREPPHRVIGEWTRYVPSGFALVVSSKKVRR